MIASNLGSCGSSNIFLAASKSEAPRTHQPARAPMAVTSRRWAGSSSISNRQRLGSARMALLASAWRPAVADLGKGGLKSALRGDRSRARQGERTRSPTGLSGYPDTSDTCHAFAAGLRRNVTNLTPDRGNRVGFVTFRPVPAPIFLTRRREDAKDALPASASRPFSSCLSACATRRLLTSG